MHGDLKGGYTVSDTSLPKAQVFLLDDHPAVREGLSILLSRHGFAICGEASNLKEALFKLSMISPDLVLVDLSLENENGLDLIKELQSAGVKSLVYSMHDDARSIRSAVAAGAQGYVTKREMVGILRDAIDTIVTGGNYISQVAAKALEAEPANGENFSVVDQLSAREQQIFEQVGEGYSTADIAETLEISISTVETNIARIILKLGFTGTKEMRRFAIRHWRSMNLKP